MLGQKFVKDIDWLFPVQFGKSKKLWFKDVLAVNDGFHLSEN